VEVAENLRALELDVIAEIREHWGCLRDYMSGLFAYLGMEGSLAEEVALIPGMDALFLLTRILREAEGGEHDLIVVDCPPTAGALRLLTFSDSACGRMNRLVEIERKVLKLIRPMGRPFKGFRQLVPKDEFYRSFGEVLTDVGRLGELLRNPEVSTVRLVLNPERVAVAETRRSYTYFGLFGFPVDGVFVNRVFPAEAAGGYFDQWCALQREQLEVIERSFLHTPLFRVSHLGHEPAGAEELERLGRDIYGERAPEGVLSDVRTVSLGEREGNPSLSFWLPGLDKSQLDLGRSGTDLMVSAGGYTRLVALPDSLASREVAGAHYEDQQLTVVFSDGERS
jgi:arsenite-transporting ATPase